MDFKLYNHLGFHNPYFIKNKAEIKLYNNFRDAINNFGEKRVLDVSSVIEVINNGFIYGDKTIINGINKTPWMAKLNKDESDWDFFDLPKHAENTEKIEEISEKLHQLLREELLSYVLPHKNIGILLTGGMDSRIVACVLKELQEENLLDSSVTIKAYTWGGVNSRDIVYAKKISELFGWEWENLIISKEQMLDNLRSTIESGSEFSPIHLHAMLQLRQKSNEVDCFLAGSFGDSIGRAEYSGTRVENLSALPLDKNFFSLVKTSLVTQYSKISKFELERYHQLFKQEKEYQQYELDYQLHYMRRMLNACMAIIDEKIPLFQMFSSPSVYEFMWSLNPNVRNNDVYKLILEKHCPQLQEIPWARTGLKYPETKGAPDNYLKSHHQYGKMIREEFLPEYKETLLNDSLNLFNMKMLKTLYDLSTKYPIKNNHNYEEVLIWIISLKKTCELYSIESPIEDFKDEIDGVRFIKDFAKYFAKFFLK